MVVLEAHLFTGKEALEGGIVDELAKPDEMLEKAVEWAERWKGKSKMGVYGILRGELVEEAVQQMQRISYVHSKPTSRHPKVKI